jgi:hypothetical protein
MIIFLVLTALFIAFFWAFRPLFVPKGYTYSAELKAYIRKAKGQD